MGDSTGMASGTWGAKGNSRRWTVYGPVGLIVALQVGLFLPALLSRGIIGPQKDFSDGLLIIYPWKAFYAAMLSRLQLPLWNPYLFGGFPFLADGQAGVLYPLNALFLIFPLDFAFKLSFLIHLILAAVFTFGFARSLGLRPVGATISAAAFSLNGLLIMYTFSGWLHALSTAAWMPAVFWAAHRLRKAGRIRWRALGLGALALGLQLTAGHPQWAFLTFFSASLFVVWLGLVEKQPPDIGRELPRRIATWLLLVLLAGGIAAAQIIPTAEAMSRSTRALSWARPGGTQGAMHPVFLTSLVAPFLFGPVDVAVSQDGWLDQYFGNEGSSFTERAAYIGILALVLAAFGIASGRDRMRHFFTLLTGLCLLLALGGYAPVYRMFLSVIPVGGTFRVPMRFLFPAVFGLCILAGYGASALAGNLATGDVARIKRWLRRLFAMAGAAILLVIVSFAIRGQLFRWGEEVLRVVYFQHGRGTYRPFAFYAGLIPQAYLTAALEVAKLGALLAATAGLGVWLVRKPAQGRLVVSVAMLLLATDLGLFASRFLFSVNDLAGYGKDAALVWTLRHDQDLYRVHPTSFAALWPGPNVVMDHGIYSTSGYTSLILREYDAFEQAMTASADPWRLVGLLGGKYVVTDGSQPVPGLPLEADGTGRVYRNPWAVPMVYLTSDAIVRGDRTAAFQAAGDHSFHARKQVVLEEPVPLGGPSAGGEGEAVATLQAFAPGQIAVRTRSSRAQVLVVNEVYYPGWRARIDGVEIPILRANGLVRAVVVPPGDHRISMQYRPRWLGGAIAGSGVSLLAAVWLGVRRQRPAEGLVLRRQANAFSAPMEGV